MTEKSILTNLLRNDDLSRPPLAGNHISPDSPILHPTIFPSQATAFAALAAKGSLVLEGGAMRGVFTAGVLDCFMDAGIHFPSIIAVSAGSCNAISFVSNQVRRNRAASIDMLAKYHYVSVRNIPEQHSVLDLNLMFQVMPRKILPYNFQAYHDNPTNLTIVATNCKTGRANYFPKAETEDLLLQEVQASCSMPFACPIMHIGKKEYVDGGVTDPIPVEYAREHHNGTCVVVCTHERGYREPLHDYTLPSLIYHDYPRLRISIINMDRVYNRQLQLVEQLADEQEIICLRPMKPVAFEHFESDVNKLNTLYEEGYNVTKEYILRYEQEHH